MTSIDDHIVTYLTALEIEGRSIKTRASYVNTLKDLRAVGLRIGLPDGVEDYTVTDVYAYLAELRSRGCSAYYQHRRHREVKTFFSSLKRMDIVRDNVFGRVRLVKLPLVIKPPFSPAEVQAMLNCQDLSRMTGCRNYALVLFLLDSGVRASECIELHLADIDWELRRAFIRHGKGEKQRWVGFGLRTADALWDYVEHFRGLDEGALFQTNRGKAMTAVWSLDLLLRRVGEEAGVEKVHPHRFRHTFATWAIESGAREIDVQMLLGHSDLTMTHRYARTYTSEQAVRAHPNLSPVNRLIAG